MTENPAATQPAARLYRSRDIRIIGGVCGGLAQYLRVDVVIVRIIALALLFTGSGFLLYILGWVIIPEEPKAEVVGGLSVPVEPQPASSLRDSTVSTDRSRWLLGGVLIAVGSWWMIRNVADEIAPWLDELILPMVLIAIGTAVVVYALKK